MVGAEIHGLDWSGSVNIMLKTSKLACLAFILNLAAFAIGVTTGASDASAQDITRPTVTVSSPGIFSDTFAHFVTLGFSEEVTGMPVGSGIRETHFVEL